MNVLDLIVKQKVKSVFDLILTLCHEINIYLLLYIIYLILCILIQYSTERRNALYKYALLA